MHPAARLSSAVAFLLIFALPAAPDAPDLANAATGIPGTLDTTFGTTGYVTALSSPAHARAVATQSDGSVIAAGDQNGQWAVARFDPLGNLDPTFGAAGVTTLFGATSSDDYACDVAVDAIDRIVVVGRRVTGGAAPFATVRLLPSGALDTSFGTNGLVETSIEKGGMSSGVAIQADGKIVVSGYSATKRYKVFAVVRYLSDGTLDTTFGDRAKKNQRKGYLTHDIGPSHDQPDEGVITLQGDGKILVGGYTGYPAQNNWTIVRYTTDGSPDPTFGTNGVVFTTFPDTNWVWIRGIGEHQGRIYASGRCFKTLVSDWDTLLAAYDSSGNLDPAFGGTGYVVSGEPGNDNGTCLAIQPDGKPVVAATFFGTTTASYITFRFNANGTRDSFYGTNGLSQPAGTTAGYLGGICLDPWGDIIVAGSVGSGSAFHFGLAKWFW